ncbi:MAG TPA: arsenate reductase ArsC [Deltaproteobacteria bacterium]|nr:arsenate reductase ArsC [Deltaproteobacteria bacterium]HOM29031.1 arsenate reductase ArsC [Deltaproteobacteria bacterium]HPP80672.1 arsenate reductase ArsC [Deltaproteobacteria bacterium]
MTRVLFVSLKGTARSRIARAWFEHLCPRGFTAASAGIRPGAAVDPLAAQVMAEVGIVLEDEKPLSVYDIYRSREVFSRVVTVCSSADARECPVFLGLVRQEHWAVKDPRAHAATDTKLLEGFRRIRDEIRELVAGLCDALQG